MARSKASQAMAIGCTGVLFPFVFGAMGLVTLWFLAVEPLTGIVRSRSWDETFCVIRASGVAEHGDSDGDTYAVDIAYDYTYGGKQYTGKRFDFSTGSSSGRDSKARATAEYPVGATRRCYVNPANPSEAVLSRAPGSYLWWGLFPLPFLAVAIVIPVFVFRKYRERPSRYTGVPRSLDQWENEGELVLRPQSSRGRRFAGLALFAVVWNTFVAFAFVWGLLPSYIAGTPDVFVSLFLTPFALVGLWVVAAVIHRFLGLFCPRISLRLSTARLYPGVQASLSWEIEGDARKLSSLTMALVGCERVTYRQGTRSRTEDHEAVRIGLFISQDPSEFARGAVELTVPEEVMPTFDAPCNKFVWSLQVQGDIRRFPDIDELFPINIHPGRTPL